MVQVTKSKNDVIFTTDNTTFRVWSDTRGASVDANALANHVKSQGLTMSEFAQWLEEQRTSNTSDRVFLNTKMKVQDLTSLFFPEEVEELEEVEEEIPPAKTVINKKKVGAK